MGEPLTVVASYGLGTLALGGVSDVRGGGQARWGRVEGELDERWFQIARKEGGWGRFRLPGGGGLGWLGDRTLD